MTEPTLYLIDTYAQIFRSFFAIRTNMRSKVTGEPTQALFAMTGFLLKLLDRFRPDYVVAVIDAPGPTFRDALHDEYKATRAETPPDLTLQIPRILELIDAMGIHQIARSGLEADDIIATIVRQVERESRAAGVAPPRIRIASKDKDLMQLLGARVTLFDVQSEAETDVAALHASKGIAPAQVIDYLTLTGDTVDNVPGVPGIGPKTAAQLLERFATLDGIYENLDQLPARQQGILRTAREQTARSRVLVTLKDDADLGFHLDHARPRGVDHARTLELFRQFDFHRFAGEVRRLPQRDALTARLSADDYDPFHESTRHQEPMLPGRRWTARVEMMTAWFSAASSSLELGSGGIKTMSITDFVVREVESAPVAYAQAQTPLESLGPTIGRLLGQVGAAASTQGVPMSGPPFCRYTDWQETSCTVECGMRTNSDFAPTDVVSVGILGEPGLHLCFSYFGPYDNLHASYEQAEVWMKANGYVWNGAPWDSYVTDPMLEPDFAKWQTDIRIPVCKA